MQLLNEKEKKKTGEARILLPLCFFVEDFSSSRLYHLSLFYKICSSILKRKSVQLNNKERRIIFTLSFPALQHPKFFLSFSSSAAIHQLLDTLDLWQ